MIQKVIKKYKTSRITLTEEQEKWLMACYENTKNKELQEKLGISVRVLQRIRRSMGLKKSPQFMAETLREATEAAHLSNLVNGTYPAKGTRIPRSEEFYFKPGVNGVDRWGAEKDAERQKKSHDSLVKTRRKEIARVAFGLDQRTNLRVVRTPDKKIKLRWYLKKLGYRIDEEERVAYYGEGTKRAVRVEAKSQKWYTFKPEPRLETADL